jgi:hypothetical protein
MSVLRGHEDLKPKAIVGFDMGFALIDCGGEVKRYRITILPNGSLHGEPVNEEPTLPDQLGSVNGDHRARARASVDQL